MSVNLPDTELEYNNPPLAHASCYRCITISKYSKFQSNTTREDAVRRISVHLFYLIASSLGGSLHGVRRAKGGVVSPPPSKASPPHMRLSWLQSSHFADNGSRVANFSATC
ncbi:hypothetical protein M8J77_002144 [Diaphorina citri]|nr:hypothetical protein M8J77_002144 [Diaphorina citri]